MFLPTPAPPAFDSSTSTSVNDSVTLSRTSQSITNNASSSGAASTNNNNNIGMSSDNVSSLGKNSNDDSRKKRDAKEKLISLAQSSGVIGNNSINSSSSGITGNAATALLMSKDGDHNLVKELHDLHNIVRARERDADTTWRKVGHPETSEKLNKMSATHESLKKKRQTIASKVQEIGDARIKHYKSFLTPFYNQHSPEKSKQDIDDIIGFYCAPTAPERINNLFTKLKDVYKSSKQAMDAINQELHRYPLNSDGLSELVADLVKIDRSLVQSSQIKDQLRRELFFPSTPKGIAPKWLIRNSFEGFYNAFGDIWIEEMDAQIGCSAVVYPPTTPDGDPKAVISLQLNPDQSTRAFKVLARVLDMVMIRKEVPIPYSARELLIELYPSISLEADFCPDRSVENPLGYWVLNEKVYKAKIYGLKAKYKGVTAGIAPPNSIMELTINTLLSFVLRRVFLFLLPPELGLYLLFEYRRNLALRPKGSEPQPWSALDIQVVNHVHSKYRMATMDARLEEVAAPYPGYKAPGKYDDDETEDVVGDDVSESRDAGDKSQQKVLEALGLSPVGLRIFLDAQRYLHYDKDFGRELRHAKTANSDKMPAALVQSGMSKAKRGLVQPIPRTEKFQPALNTLSIILRYYHRFFLPLSREERETVVSAWQAALNASAADLYPKMTEPLSFLKILESIQKVVTKPVKFSMKQRLDVRGDLRKLVSVIRSLFLRVAGTSASKWGGFEFRRPNIRLDANYSDDEDDDNNGKSDQSGKGKKKSAENDPPMMRRTSDVDKTAFGKESRVRSFSQMLHKIHSEKEAQSYIEEMANKANGLLDFFSQSLLRMMDVKMEGVFAGGEFRAVLEDLQAEVPMNLHMSMTGELLEHVLRGPSAEWPWKHEPLARPNHFQWLISPIDENLNNNSSSEDNALEAANQSSIPKSTSSASLAGMSVSSESGAGRGGKPRQEIRVMISDVQGSIKVIPSQPPVSASSSSVPPVGSFTSLSALQSVKGEALKQSVANASNSPVLKPATVAPSIPSDAMKFSFAPVKSQDASEQRFGITVVAPEAFISNKIKKLETRGSLRAVKKYADDWVRYFGDNAPNLIHFLMERIENYSSESFQVTQAFKLNVDCSHRPDIIYSMETLDEVRPALSINFEVNLMDLIQDVFEIADLIMEDGEYEEEESD